MKSSVYFMEVFGLKKTILTIVAFVLTLTIFAPFPEAKEPLNIKELTTLTRPMRI